MKIFKLQQNFFFKIIGISVILFLIIDSQKDNPDSVARLINKENIATSTKIISKEGKNIIQKAAIAKEMKKRVSNNDYSNQNIIIIDEIDSFDMNVSKCGDLVNLKIEILDSDDNLLFVNDNEDIEIGQNKYPQLEKYILNMGQGGVRVISIPHNHNMKSEFINQFRSNNSLNIIIKLTMLNILHSNNKYNCQ